MGPPIQRTRHQWVGWLDYPDKIEAEDRREGLGCNRSLGVGCSGLGDGSCSILDLGAPFGLDFDLDLGLGRSGMEPSWSGLDPDVGCELAAGFAFCNPDFGLVVAAFDLAVAFDLAAALDLGREADWCWDWSLGSSDSVDGCTAVGPAHRNADSTRSKTGYGPPIAVVVDLERGPGEGNSAGAD